MATITIFPCPNHMLCGDVPLANLSAEKQDFALAISTFFPVINQPLMQRFTAEGCIGVCTSTISQEDADICAALQAAQCVVTPPPPPNQPPPVCVTPGGCGFTPPPNNPPPPPNQPPPTASPCNTPQICCVECPDGTSFCYTVPACQFGAQTVAQANVIAKAYACKQAGVLLLCIFGEPALACVGQTYTTVLFATGGAFQNYVWSIIDGELPPGTTGAAVGEDGSQFVITGTPTTPGNFTFTVRVDDVSEKGPGSFQIKTFTIPVVGVSSGDPPEATIGQPYSFQFTADGGVPPYTFAVTGILPAGLTLSPEGLLSGTPLGPAESTHFSICVVDSSGSF